eukprot:9478163-Pyramimonas_sp.AAC.2
MAIERKPAVRALTSLGPSWPLTYLCHLAEDFVTFVLCQQVEEDRAEIPAEEDRVRAGEPRASLRRSVRRSDLEEIGGDCEQPRKSEASVFVCGCVRHIIELMSVISAILTDHDKCTFLQYTPIRGGVRIDNDRASPASSAVSHRASWTGARSSIGR